MGLKALIRTLVVATHSTPPFSKLNQQPYRFALHRLKALAAAEPSVVSLYLRHGMTRHDWVPGLSDIDLTLVLDGGLSSHEEYQSTCRLLEACQSLKKWLPMLGEVDIMSESCCRSWTRFSIRGAETENWILLYGSETVECHYGHSYARRRKDSLSHACLIYEGYGMRQFHSSTNDRWIDVKALQRVARKEQRYGSWPAEEGTEAPGPLARNTTGLVLDMLTHLETQTRAFLGQARQVAALPTDTHLVQEPAEQPGYFASNFNVLRNHDDLIHSVILSYSHSMVVLNDRIPRDRLQSGLEEIRNSCHAAKIRPLILTRHVFRYFLQIYRPRLWLELIEHRYILFGEDLLQDLAEPCPQALASEALDFTLSVMLAPAGQVAGFRGSAQKDDWIRHAWRAAFLMLYLETSTVGSHQRSVNACRSHFPDLCTEIDELTAVDSKDSLNILSVYELLGRCARQIDRQVRVINPDRLTPAHLLGS